MTHKTAAALVAGLSGFVAIVNPAGAGQALAASADGTRLVSAGYSYSGGAPPDLVLGQIMISTNAGASWGPTSAPANAWQAVASSADGTKLAATDGLGWGGDGLIYTSTNSGASWAPTVAPASVWLSIASSADGATLVAAAINYFYISTNSGAAWVSADAQSYQSAQRTGAAPAPRQHLLPAETAIEDRTTWTRETKRTIRTDQQPNTIEPNVAHSDFPNPEHTYSWKTLLQCEEDPEAIKERVRRNQRNEGPVARHFGRIS